MDISVVIPSYNTQDTIETTLVHLENQETRRSYEVLVVDCSEHDKVQRVTERFTQVKYHHRAQRFNPGEGRNIGAQLAQGELLIFIDADVELSHGALEAAWKHYKDGCEIFGGALELNTRVHSDLAAYLEHYFFNHESQAGRPFCERSNLSSALMCFKKALFLAEGGFRDIPRMQDTELTERLRAKGHKLYFCPDVLAYQTQDSPLKKVFRKIFINGQNLYYIRYKPSITAGKKALFFVALPFIALAKSLRIIGRHLRYQPLPNKIKTLTLVPALLAAGAYWMLGFYEALLTEKGISSQR